ncbi:MAG: Rieske 2Fe-2S domain-containing protein, partial [Dehalococcoidia bacterium]
FRNEEEEQLFQMGPGTPSGEVFRRYWLPVETSTNLAGGKGPVTPHKNNPLPIKVLGENLVLFRDSTGKPGLVAEHCSHRGASLRYGRVEDDGLRCIYHGWKYDRAGNCLDMPAEPAGRKFIETVKHPSYPCIEVGGLIFAYMGPPEKQPPFPMYPALFREDGLRVTGKGNRIQNSSALLQTLDNVLDVWHREINHTWFKGGPPGGTMHHGRDGEPATPLKFEHTPWGACYVVLNSSHKPGMYEYHETHAVMPGQRGRMNQMNWAVPIDDYRTRWFGVNFFPFDENGKIPQSAYDFVHNDRPSDAGGPFYEGWMEDVGYWWNLGHPSRQGPIWEDEVAMSTQGPEERNRMPDWDKWHLGSSDRGLVLMHRLWKEQVERVQDGADPIGIIRGEAAEEIIPMPGKVFHVDHEEGMRLFDRTIEERIEATREELQRSEYRKPSLVS